MRKFSLLLLFLLIPEVVFADELNSADTAWILTSAGLVLFMTLPGIALFYGGLVRTKNVLSVIMACFSITALISVIWAMAGYSLALTDGGSWQAVLGGFSQLFLFNMNADRLIGNLPESVFSMYHMTFAIFAPALIVGGLAERVRFFPCCFFAHFGKSWFMYPFAIGSGAMAGYRNWASWTLPEALWFMAARGLRQLSARLS